MKPDKVFVRYKNLSQAQGYTRERPQKRPYDKKKYAEKNNRPRQALKIIYDSFQPATQIPPIVTSLIAVYPKFFNKEGRAPEKDSNELLNDFVILNTKRFLDSLKDNKKEEHPSSSDPDWNSDDDIDCNLESKVIEDAVIQKFVEKMGDKAVKKAQILKPHQKRFLQDYFRSKRLQEPEEQIIVKPAKIEQKPLKPLQPVNRQIPSPSLKQTSKQSEMLNFDPTKPGEKPRNIWSEYQARQVNTFVDLGFMTKIEDNEQQITAEVADDDMFKSEEEQVKQASPQKREESSSQQQDDIFGDETPTTIKTKHEIVPATVESEKKITQGTVVVNDHMFSKIAQAIGLLPIRCNWIIKNEYNKFKVTTEYMDAYYRKEKMYEILPLISLNHSEFVNNEKVETAEGLQILRDYNYRLSHNNYQGNQRGKQYYKQKHSTHLKKK